MSAPKVPALRVTLNPWGNWHAYRGGRAVDSFMGTTEEQAVAARAWLEAQIAATGVPHRIVERPTFNATGITYAAERIK